MPYLQQEDRPGLIVHLQVRWKLLRNAPLCGGAQLWTRLQDRGQTAVGKEQSSHSGGQIAEDLNE